MASAAASGGTVPRKRIHGIDVARALAILGMFAVHVGPTDAAGVAGRFYAAPHGRASLLFVVLAGVGVTLLHRARSSSSGQARLTLLWRALLLLPLGLALQELDIHANVILQDYALLFVFAVLVMGLPDRWLLALVAVSLTLGPIAVLWGRAQRPETFERGGTALSDAPDAIVEGLTLSGPYPLVTWAAPFLFGVWLARRDLRSARIRRALVLGGAVTTAGAAFLDAALLAVLGEPAAPHDPRHLASAAPHSQMPLWLVGGIGSAVLVLGLCLLAADRARGPTRPLAAAGQLALTAYVGHLLALHAAPDLLISETVGRATAVVLVSALVIVTAAAVWRDEFSRGPLEAVLHLPWLGRPRAGASRRDAVRPGPAVAPGTRSDRGSGAT